MGFEIRVIAEVGCAFFLQQGVQSRGVINFSSLIFAVASKEKKRGFKHAFKDLNRRGRRVARRRLFGLFLIEIFDYRFPAALFHLSVKRSDSERSDLLQSSRCLALVQGIKSSGYFSVGADVPNSLSFLYFEVFFVTDFAPDLPAHIS